MHSFLFNTVSDVLSGPGTSGQLGEMAAAMGIERLFVVTDPGIIQFGLLQQAVESLEANNIALHIYSDIVADPPESVVINAMHAAQDFGCDGVIGFGGGSSMDVAKLLAVLIKGEQQLADIYGVDQIIGGRLPLIQVPTTAGTGSEATMVSIITTGETTKAGVVSRTLLADKIMGFVEYAVAHREVIEKFGRFPHRNKILGRESTAEELVYLASGRGSF